MFRSLISSAVDAVMYTFPPWVDEAVHEVKEAAPREKAAGAPVMEMNIPPPFTAVQEVNEVVSAIEREEVEETTPEIAPPFPVAKQDSKLTEEMVRTEVEVGERVNEIAPPFDDVQLWNVAPEIVCGASMELNSNTLPSPERLLMKRNSFVPLSVSFPADTSITGLLSVV